MTSIKKIRWGFASSLFPIGLLWGLAACSDDKVVVIQPGKFSDDWPTELRKELVDEKKCAIDQINGKDPHQNELTFKSGQMINIQGWVFTKADGAPPSLYIQLVGPALTYTALTHTRLARPDVINYFQLDQAWNPGFELNAEQNVEPGEYELEILQPGNHGIARCSTHVAIKIDPAATGG